MSDLAIAAFIIAFMVGLAISRSDLGPRQPRRR